MATEVASLFATLNLRDNLTDGLNKAKGGVSGFADHIKSAGSAVSGLGTDMLKASAPIVAALGIAVTSAMGFDEQMRNIQSVTGQTDQEIAALGDTILAMDSKFSNVEMAQTFYDVAGGVSDATQHMDVYNTAIDVATAGNANLQATTQAIIGTVNAFGISAEYAGDIFTRTVGMGVGSMDQFAAALPGVNAIAAAVGVSFREVGAAAAYLTTKGLTAGEAGTQLEAVMTSLLNPNQAMIDAFEEAGIQSGSMALEQLGLVGTLDLLNAAFDGNVDAMTKAFGSKEALGAALGLAGEDVEAFFEAYDAGLKGATDAAAEAQQKSASYQWGVLKNNFEDIAIMVGQELLPVLIDLGNDIKPMIRSFADFIKQNPQVVRTVAMVAGGIAVLGTAFTVVGGAISVFGTAFGVVAGIIGLVLSPIGLVVAGVAALGAALFFLSGGSLADVVDLFERGTQWIKNFAGGLVEAFQSGGISGAADFINNNLVTPIRNVIENTDWGALGSNLWNKIKTNLSNAAAGIDWGAVATTMINGVIDALQFGGEVAWDAANFIYNKVLIPLDTAIANANWDDIAKDVTNGIIDGIKLLVVAVDWADQWLKDKVVQPLIDKAKTADWGSIGNDLWTGFKNAITTAITGFIDFHVFIYDNIIKPVMDELGIASPSTVFYTIGENVVQGLVDALLTGTFTLIGAVAGWGAALLSSFLGGLGDLGGWITTNVINPMVGGLNGAVDSFRSAASAIAGAVMGPFDSIIGKANAVLQAIGLANGASAQVTSETGTVTNDSNGNTTITVNATPRAGGGPIAAGGMYMVGEEGPELFVSGSSGRVISNHDLGNMGGGGLTINGGTFHFHGVQDVRKMYDQLMKEGGRRAPSAAMGKVGI